MNLIGPLRALPIKIHSVIIPVSTFIYNESFLFAISLPAALVLYMGLHNPYILFIIIAYTILFIYAARLISLALEYYGQNITLTGFPKGYIYRNLCRYCLFSYLCCQYKL